MHGIGSPSVLEQVTNAKEVHHINHLQRKAMTKPVDRNMKMDADSLCFVIKLYELKYFLIAVTFGIGIRRPAVMTLFAW